MVIPGFTILLFVATLLHDTWIVEFHKIDATIFWVVAITLSYLIGIANEVISRCLWGGLRNNLAIINEQLKKIRDEIGHVEHLPKYEDTINTPLFYQYLCCCGIFGFAFLGLFLFFVNMCMSLYESCQYFVMVIAVFALIVFMLMAPSKLSNLFCTTNDTHKLLDTYFKAYYYSQNSSYNSSFSIIEGQVAFLQNMCVPLLLFIVLPAEKYSILFESNCPSCLIKGLLAVLLFSEVYVIYKRIEKIHYLVWSDYEYLQRIEKKNK